MSPNPRLQRTPSAPLSRQPLGGQLAKLKWMNVVAPAALWLVGTLVVNCVRHGALLLEDLAEAVVLAAVVGVAGFLIELFRARKRPVKRNSDGA